MKTKVYANGFNPSRDYKEVDQFGFVNIDKALVEGIVPSDLQVKEESFNSIDDPKSIIGKPQDAFDAIRMHSSINKADAALRSSAEQPPKGE